VATQSGVENAKLIAQALFLKNPPLIHASQSAAKGAAKARASSIIADWLHGAKCSHAIRVPLRSKSGALVELFAPEWLNLIGSMQIHDAGQG
jgi:hypothetical protein